MGVEKGLRSNYLKKVLKASLAPTAKFLLVKSPTHCSPPDYMDNSSPLGTLLMLMGSPNSLSECLDLRA